ncbi:MAG: T9SS type A sorting domain-containing protein [Cytophagales bacterium]|nr:T9SS type A sorting domain-containing protein [Cytophagales bacterium]
MYKKVLFSIIISISAICTKAQLPYILPAAQDTTQFGRYLQRSMKLLATSSPSKRNTVKIMVYGQSIAKQEWSDTVRKLLKKRFPYAHIIMTNRSIGGCWAGCLQDPVEYDIKTFYPDLVLFDVYGWNSWGSNQGPQYENIIRYIREHTAAEVGMQTHHVTNSDRAQGVDNSDFIRLRNTYGVELVDVRTPWLNYLNTNNITNANDLTTDGSHLNDWGNFLMARLWLPYLQYKPQFASDTFKQVKTYRVGTDVFWVNGKITLPFNGNKVELVAGTPTAGADSAKIFIDGNRPSTIPGTVMFLRPNEPFDTVFKHFDQYDWPWQKGAIMKFNQGAKPKPETWTLQFTSYSNTTSFAYNVVGSKTGADGSGSYAGNVVFTSTSKIVTFDRSKFWLNTASYPNTFIGVGFQIKWEARPYYSNTFIPPVTVASSVVDSVVTAAQGITNNNHLLEIQATGAGNTPLKEIRIYQPYHNRVADNFTITAPNLAVTTPGAACASVGVNITNIFTDTKSITGIVTYWRDAGATLSITAPNMITVSGTYYIKKQAILAGLSDIKPVIVSIITCQPNLLISHPAPICAPNNIDITNKYIDINSVPGTVTYWRDAGATITLTSPMNISATGIYYIKKTSTVGGYIDIKNITVTINALPVLNINAATTLCSGLVVTATATGANTYTWLPGNLTGAVQSLSPAITSTYTISGTTSGCSGLRLYTLTVLSSPSVNIAGATALCSGTGTSLTLSGANTYLWMPGNLNGAVQSLSPTVTTTYTVTGIHVNGCSNKNLFTVTVSSTPNILINGNQNICLGAATTLTASGTANFIWYPGSISGNTRTLSPTSHTTYTISGSNGPTCNASKIFMITVNSLPNITTSGTYSICTGANAAITATGGNTYNWTPGNLSGTTPLLSPTSTTPYTVLGTNTLGCTNKSIFTITVNSPPILTINGMKELCKNSSTTLTASGANTYTWHPGNIVGATQILSPSTSANYTITGISTQGCAASLVVNVTVNSLPTVSVSGTASCIGTPASMAATGANTYVWYPGSLSGNNQTFNPSVTTIYTVVGTSIKGCVSSTLSSYIVHPLPVMTLSGNRTICQGQSSSFTVSGAVFYAWQPGGFTTQFNTFAPAITTAYQITGTDALGCVGLLDFTITVNGLPNIAVNGTTSLCTGGNTTLTASGANTYTWMPGSLAGASQTFTPSTTTAYTVTGIDGRGCANKTIKTVTVSGTPTVLLNGNLSICEGMSTTITASGTNIFIWYPGSVTGSTRTLTPATNTTYSVTGYNSPLCQTTQTFTVSVHSIPHVSIAGISEICTGSAATLTASGADTYHWMPGNLAGYIQTLNPTSATTYTVIGTNTPANCTTKNTFTVNIHSPSQAGNIHISNTKVCLGNTVNISLSGYNGYVSMYHDQKLISTQSTLSGYVVTNAGSIYAIVQNGICTAATTAGINIELINMVNAPEIIGNITVNIGTLNTYSVTSLAGESYIWVISGSNTLTGQNTESVTVAGIHEGIYYLGITASNDCYSMGSTITVTGIKPPNNVTILGIKEAEDSYVSIFPNPAHDYIIVSTTHFKAPFTVHIYNILGQSVYTATVNGSIEMLPINLQKGIYYAKIQKKTHKLLIE